MRVVSALLLVVITSVVAWLYLTRDTAPEFALLSELTRERVLPDPSANRQLLVREETLIVRHLPEQEGELRSLVDEYNRATLTPAQLRQYDVLRRAFYRTSDELPLDYRENEGFLADRIEDHTDELALVIEWRGSWDSARTTFYRNGIATH